MTTASRFISRWAVGNTIDSLTILSLGETSDGKLKPKTCTVLCADCGQTSEMRTDAIHTRHFRNKVKTACKACNFKADNDKRSKAKSKNKYQFDYDRFVAGNEIGKLKILSVVKPDGVSGVKWKITSECLECKKVTAVQAEFLIQKLTKGIDLCRFCAVVEREKSTNKINTPITVSAIAPLPEPEKVNLNIKNKAFDLLRYKIGRSASRVSFV